MQQAHMNQRERFIASRLLALTPRQRQLFCGGWYAIRLTPVMLGMSVYTLLMGGAILVDVQMQPPLLNIVCFLVALVAVALLTLSLERALDRAWQRYWLKI